MIPSRKAGWRISARSQETLAHFIANIVSIPLQNQLILINKIKQRKKGAYHKPSIMSVTGLVNLGTILDVVSDLKP